MSVYTLALEDDHYYVGYSADPETRIASHFLGRGAQWTRLHAPVAVLNVRPGDTALENLTTIALMAKVGWEKVRGGRYTTLQLPCMPRPLTKAYALKAPPPLPEMVEQEVIGDHAAWIVKLSDGPHAWRARLSGQKAAEECPVIGFKTIYGETEEAVRAEAARWVGVEETNTESSAAALPNNP